MAAINHAFAAVTTTQTTTSASYADVSGAAIASGSFTAGKKYLICVTAVGGFGDNVALGEVAVVHGSTVFAESQDTMSISPFFKTYSWFTVWTAVSSEGIKVQFRCSGGITLTLDTITVLAINLTDDLVENTDWFFAEDSSDDSLTTTPLAGGSITFTPATASHDWLVMTHSQIDITSSSILPISRISRSGEASSSLPECRTERRNAFNFSGFGLSRVFTLGNASNTFAEQSSAASTAHTRLHSKIFALNLNKFSDHSFAYTEADVGLSATDYATALQTLGITPAVQSDVWIGAYWGWDSQATGREGESRVQVDNVDQPAGQTTANRQLKAGTDATDEDPINHSTLVAAMTAAAHTVDLDGSADSTTSTPSGQHRTLWAVTMELAAGGAPSPDRIPKPHISKWAVQRAASW